MSGRVGRVADWLRVNPIAVVIGLLAVVVRLASSGWLSGLTGNVLGDDPGIYFAAGMALGHGQLPYSDFTLVHPPGVAVALAPLALAGDWFSDPTAFALARLGMILLGGVNAVLAYCVGARVGKTCAIVAGLLWVVLPGTVYVERTVYLDAPMLCATLVGLLLYGSSRANGKWIVVAGALAGIAVTFKLWAVVPLLVLTIAWAARRELRTAVLYLGSAVVTVVVVCLPFLVASGWTMIEMIFFDQVGRERVVAPLDRLGYMFAINSEVDDPTPWLLRIAILLGLLALFVLVWLGVAKARLWVILCIVQIAVVLYVPTFYWSYRSYYAIGLILVIAAFAQLVADRVRVWQQEERRGLALATGVVVSLLFLGGFGLFSTRLVVQGSGDEVAVGTLSEAVADGRCVTAANASWLTVSDSLTRTLDNGCAFQADLLGNHLIMPRAEYVAMRNEYLDTGDYVILERKEAHSDTPVTRGRPIVYEKKPIVVLGPRQ